MKIFNTSFTLLLLLFLAGCYYPEIPSSHTKIKNQNIDQVILVCSHWITDHGYQIHSFENTKKRDDFYFLRGYKKNLGDVSVFNLLKGNGLFQDQNIDFSFTIVKDS